MYGCRRLRGILGVGERLKRLVGMGQLIISIGASLHKGLPPHVRDFLLLTTTHVLIICDMCCKYVFCEFIFFSHAG
jgi:hypothetical protein